MAEHQVSLPTTPGRQLTRVEWGKKKKKMVGKKINPSQPALTMITNAPNLFSRFYEPHFIPYAHISKQRKPQINKALQAEVNLSASTGLVHPRHMFFS
jgi:hypothetical protein